MSNGDNTHWCYRCRQEVCLCGCNSVCPYCDGGFVQELDDMDMIPTVGLDSDEEREPGFGIMEAFSALMRQQIAGRTHDHDTRGGTSAIAEQEYGYTMNITEKSDVYSYGIVLLEILSGCNAVESQVGNGLHIVEWVKKKMGSFEPAINVLDAKLQGMPDQMVQEMLQTLGIARFCVNSSPAERPAMKEVVAFLKEVKNQPEEWGKTFPCVKKNQPEEWGKNHSLL